MTCSVILDNIKKIRCRIDSAAARAGRDSKSVVLVVAAKYAPLEAVRRVCESGLVSEIGENRVQDAGKRKALLRESAGKVRWRMIGRLQSNKAAKAAEIFDSVDSVDSVKLAEKLHEGAQKAGKRLPVLLQVKLTEKQSQGGLDGGEIASFLDRLRKMDALEAKGLMTIAPRVDDPELARPAFKKMRLLFEEFFKDVPGAHLSMGMSEDFEVAVEEGSTMVRLGRAVFDPVLESSSGIGQASREGNS
jgi:pyridoxal phosphate enzyme (YggS family)